MDNLISDCITALRLQPTARRAIFNGSTVSTLETGFPEHLDADLEDFGEFKVLRKYNIQNDLPFVIVGYSKDVDASLTP